MVSFAWGACEGGADRLSRSIFTADMTWADIDWVKKFAPGLPILIKGIACVADVELAKKHGASGVILSNHGVSSFVPSFLARTDTGHRVVNSISPRHR